MKIFYAVQATGNGHISRAMELLPLLQEFGTVDIFLSGENSHLPLDAPVKYRSKGISLFYNCKGGLDYLEMWKRFKPFRVRKEIRDLPVEKYDLVLNDFDFITSAACARKGISSVHFGHQASFLSERTPRPLKRNITGEWLLKHYVKATCQVGLHFKRYDHFVLPAIVKKSILAAIPENKGHITVYLPSFCESQLKDIFSFFRDVEFHLFSRETSLKRRDGNIIFMPVDKEQFDRSLVTCHGIITGGGFETPAEALHLGKKILSIPIRGQYEQQCNAAALQQLGVTCLPGIIRDFKDVFPNWMNNAPSVRIDYTTSARASVEYLFALLPGLVPGCSGPIKEYSL